MAKENKNKIVEPHFCKSAISLARSWICIYPLIAIWTKKAHLILGRQINSDVGRSEEAIHAGPSHVKLFGCAAPQGNM